LTLRSILQSIFLKNVARDADKFISTVMADDHVIGKWRRS